MREVLELPRLSLKERDRRWATVRREMEARDLDAIVLWGWPTMWDFCIANTRYLCPVGGNAEFNVLVFPRAGEPTCFIQMPTFLEGWRSAQDWVTDIRPRKGSWADTVAARLKGAQARARPHRDGRARRPARSRRLGAAQRLRPARRASAQRHARQPRGHARAGPHHQERGGDRCPRARGTARRSHAGSLPRDRTPGREGMRGLCPHDGGDASQRR